MVLIDGEWIPFKLIGYNTIQRKGYTIKADDGTRYLAQGTITHVSGVTVDGVNWPLTIDSDGVKHVEMTCNHPMPFTIVDKVGGNLIVCEYDFTRDDYKDDFIKSHRPIFANDVVSQSEYYYGYVKNQIFGRYETTIDLPFKVSNAPTSTDDYYDVLGNLSLYATRGYVNIPISLHNSQENGLLISDARQSDFCKVTTEPLVNEIVDMERDVYIPCSGNNLNGGVNAKFTDIDEIVFNLHFRTRDLTSWKVYEEGSYSNTNMCNWFVTDYEPYKNYASNEAKRKQLLESSDLLGLLGFYNNDVYYQKKKLSSSFLRLTYYDTIDPKTQSLLCMNTVFMDTHPLYKKYVDNMRNGQFIGMTPLANEASSSKTSTVMCESGTDVTHLCINETAETNSRLSSRFTVKSKHDECDSSEGFYLYIFKEYSTELHPRQIFMKVEFNHARFR